MTMENQLTTTQYYRNTLLVGGLTALGCEAMGARKSLSSYGKSIAECGSSIMDSVKHPILASQNLSASVRNCLANFSSIFSTPAQETATTCQDAARAALDAIAVQASRLGSADAVNQAKALTASLETQVVDLTRSALDSGKNAVQAGIETTISQLNGQLDVEGAAKTVYDATKKAFTGDDVNANTVAKATKQAAINAFQFDFTAASEGLTSSASTAFETSSSAINTGAATLQGTLQTGLDSISTNLLENEALHSNIATHAEAITAACSATPESTSRLSSIAAGLCSIAPTKLVIGTAVALLVTQAVASQLLARKEIALKKGLKTVLSTALSTAVVWGGSALLGRVTNINTMGGDEIAGAALCLAGAYCFTKKVAFPIFHKLSCCSDFKLFGDSREWQWSYHPKQEKIEKTA